MDCRFYNIVLHCHISKSLAFVFIYLLHHHRLDKNRKIHKYGFKLSRCNIHRFIGLRKPPGARSCSIRWYIPMPHDNLFILKAHVRPIDFARLCFCLFHSLVHDFDWMSLSLGFSDIPSCRDDTSAAFTHKLIKGDFMIFRLCENQRSVHCFLGEHWPLSLRSYSFGGAQLLCTFGSWESSAYLHKL